MGSGTKMASVLGAAMAMLGGAEMRQEMPERTPMPTEPPARRRTIRNGVTRPARSKYTPAGPRRNVQAGSPVRNPATAAHITKQYDKWNTAREERAA